MTRVLIVTVGGSPDPILKAVELHHPDEVIFVCSAPPCERPSIDQVIGEGTPCQHIVAGCAEWRPNLVTQLKLTQFREDLHLFGLPDPDDLCDCVIRLRNIVRILRQRIRRLDLLGDFTGGTKSMSAALAISLLDGNAEVSVVGGRRNSLLKIDRSEGLRVVDPIPLLAHRLIESRLPPLLEGHLYDRARALLADFRRDHCHRLSTEQLQDLDSFSAQLQVLVLWDSFRWREALNLADQISFSTSWPDLWSWWLRVEASTDWDVVAPPPVAITGYELVQDLLLNAERRGRRGWYDDAVARLYRAAELLAQTYTHLELGLDSNPDWSQRKLTLVNGEVFPNSGVRKLYSWLADYETKRGYGHCDNGLGSIFSRQWREFQRLFDSRNSSLLGHGLTPIPEASWQSLQARVTNLITSLLVELGIQQGPAPAQLPGLLLLRLPALQSLRLPVSVDSQ